MSEPTQTKFEEWCLVELMGHQRIVGKVTEAVVGGAALLRVDVPGMGPTKPAFTRLYGASAIYCISIISEEIARGLMARDRNDPVSRFELPQIAEKVSNPETLSQDYCQGCRELTENCTCPECDGERDMI